jgi:hypothetical protein
MQRITNELGLTEVHALYSKIDADEESHSCNKDWKLQIL